MRALLSTLQRVPEFEDLLLRIDAGRCPVAASGLSPVHRAFVAAGIAQRLERPIVLLCPEEVECAKLSRDLEALLEVPVLQLPGREFTFHAAATVSHQWEHKRLAVFKAMAQQKAPVVVATVEGRPRVEEVLPLVTAPAVELVPLMLVAGDHALHDMAGEGPDSWKRLLQSRGHAVSCRLTGLGALPLVQALYVRRLEELRAGS